MKISWRRCVEFNAVSQAYLARTKDADTKLCYAIKRISSKLGKLQESVRDALADIEIDCCVTDENGVITRDAQGNLQYTKEGLRQRNKLTREYLDQANVELDSHFVTVFPDDLTEREIEAFSGTVIKTEDADRLLSEMLTGDRSPAVTQPNGHQSLASVGA